MKSRRMKRLRFMVVAIRVAVARSGEIEKERFRVVSGDDFERIFLFDGGSVTRFERSAIQRHGSPHDLKPGGAACPQRMLGGFAGLESQAVDVGVLRNRGGVLPAVR